MRQILAMVLRSLHVNQIIWKGGDLGNNGGDDNWQKCSACKSICLICKGEVISHQ